MANRHSHKKQRAEIRARMAATGESYQTTLARLVSERHGGIPHGIQRLQRAPRAPWLLPASYFGVPVTLAVYELFSHASVILVSGCDGPLGLPLAKASPLHVHTGGLS
jgi:hypothetical protein